MSKDDTRPAGSPDNITLIDIMRHMQGMELRLRDEFKEQIEKVRHELCNELRGEMRSMEGRLTTRIDTLERNLTGQIEGIDGRLDGLEIVQLPKRVQRIEEHVGLAA